MKILIRYGIGRSTYEHTIEVDDDAPHDEIDQDVYELVLQRIDWSWERVP